MINKQNLKQRTISDLNIETKETKNEIGLRLIEGRLSVNVARIGSMYPYVKVIFGTEIWKSESSSTGGMHPKWNCYHLFEILSQTLEIIVYDKVFLFGDTEIGRCTIHLADVLQGHLTEWWNILSPKQEIAGAVLLSFELHEQDTFSIHSSNSSWDFRGHHHLESSPIIPRVKKVQSVQINNMTPDYKSLHFTTEPDECYKLEQLRFDLMEENERLKAQESKVRVIFDKLKIESNKLKIEKVEVNKCTETLKRKEENILSQRAKLEDEKLYINLGKEEIIKLKESLNSSYSRLKQEKLKMRTHKKLLERRQKYVK